MHSLSLRFGLVFAAMALGGCQTAPENGAFAGTSRGPGSVRLEYVRTPCDTLPYYLSGEAPLYPSSQQGKHGQAVLEFTIDEAGRTQDVRLISEIGQFFGSHAAVAVRRWRFDPALKDGKPIAVAVHQTIEFGDPAEEAQIADPIWKAYRQGAMATQKKDYDFAINRFNGLLLVDDPVMHIRVLGSRGRAYAGKKEYAQAIADEREAIRLYPNGDEVRNQLAWLLATCPEASVRDGKQAVELAQRACQLEGWKRGSVLDTLAAAYAETGDFDQAIAWQQKAVDLHDVPKATLKKMSQRLALYQQHRPYHETD